MLNRFQIPKIDAGRFIYALFAPQQPPPFIFQRMTSIYDVTDEIRYIGTIADENFGTWLEYDIKAGMRTLMLIRTLTQPFPAEGSRYHTDFLEIEVQPGTTHLVAVSAYGFNQDTYFARLIIDEQHRKACTGFHNMEYRLLKKTIEAYMEKNGIPPHVDTFRDYCKDLAQSYIIKPNSIALSEFNKAKPIIEALRKENFPTWKMEEERVYAPYELARPVPGYVDEEELRGSNSSHVTDFPR